MEPLAKLLVSFIELAETELTMLKQGVIKLALGLVMVIGAGVMGVIGLCWILDALFIWLERLTGTPGALAISGVLFLAIAGVLVMLAFSTRKKPPVAATAQPPASPHEGKDDDAASSMRIAS